jgi:putative Holliday junction resolvase
MPRILSIDYGQKRTGIAVTDEMKIIASGLTTIQSATSFPEEYFQRKVEAVIIGRPIQMNATQKVHLLLRSCNPFYDHFRI